MLWIKFVLYGYKNLDLEYLNELNELININQERLIKGNKYKII